MSKPKRPGGPKQKLSPAAAKRKAARDLKIAKTPRRTAYKAETQRKRREAEKNGQNIKGKDWDHNTNSFVSEKTNRSATKTTNNTMKKKTPLAREKKPTLLEQTKAKLKARTKSRRTPTATKPTKPNPKMTAKIKARQKSKTVTMKNRK